jgi:hypothetical protein
LTSKHANTSPTWYWFLDKPGSIYVSYFTNITVILNGETRIRVPTDACMTVDEDWKRRTVVAQTRQNSSVAFVFKSAKTFRARARILVPNKATSQSRLLYEFQKTDESLRSETAKVFGHEIQCSQILDLFNAFVLHLELPLHRT